MADAFRLRVRDTLSQRKVRVRPTTKRGRQELSLYVCGVTPYDSGHMGHAFTSCMFDILVRFAEASGVRVRYVQNVLRRDNLDADVMTGKSFRIHGAEGQEVMLPKAILDFLDAFNKGAYPDLELPPN